MAEHMIDCDRHKLRLLIHQRRRVKLRRQLREPRREFSLNESYLQNLRRAFSRASSKDRRQGLHDPLLWSLY